MATGVSALVTWNRAHACPAVSAMLASLHRSWVTPTGRRTMQPSTEYAHHDTL